MKTALSIFLSLLLAGPLAAATLVMSGPLYYSNDPAFQADPAGAFRIELTGTSLTYTVTTRSLPESFSPESASMLLGLPAGLVALPFTSHLLTGMSGCRLVFGSTRSVSFYLPAAPDVPFGIVDPGVCDGYLSFSWLSGFVLLTDEQTTEFSRPGFTISGIGLNGRLSPDIIAAVPEPSVSLLSAFSVAILARRYRRRANALVPTAGTALSSMLSVTPTRYPISTLTPAPAVGTA